MWTSLCSILKEIKENNHQFSTLHVNTLYFIYHNYQVMKEQTSF